MQSLIKVGRHVELPCAWHIKYNETRLNAVVFAHDEQEAIAASREAGITFLPDAIISAARFPDADRFFEAGPIPAEFLIRHGFELDCAHCARPLYLAGLEATELEDIVDGQEGRAFCDTVCHAWESLRAAIIARCERRWTRRMTRLIGARFPNASFDFCKGGGLVSAKARDGGETGKLEQARITFKLPGMSQASSLEYDASKPRRRFQWVNIPIH